MHVYYTDNYALDNPNFAGVPVMVKDCVGILQCPGVNGRVITNLENLEYSGISMNIENLGYCHEILCDLREHS